MSDDNSHRRIVAKLDLWQVEIVAELDALLSAILNRISKGEL